MVGSGVLGCWGWFGPTGGCGCVLVWLEAWYGGGGPRTDANEPVCGLAHSNNRLKGGFQKASYWHPCPHCRIRS